MRERGATFDTKVLGLKNRGGKTAGGTVLGGAV